MSEHTPISNRAVLLLAFASAIVTANAYYIHPILRAVAEGFGISEATVGVVPALNQIALALGVLILLPLGDRVSNRRLVVVCLGVQVIALITMASTREFIVFAGASTVLGFFTITPYLLPAYASKRVEGPRLGFVTAMLTSGVIAGVQLSRLASGVIGEYLDWRAVYWLAAALMALSAIGLPLLMADETPRSRGGPSYVRLLGSLPRLVRENPNVIISGLIQGCNFAMFIAIWLGISLHLTSAEMGKGSDLVGYLTAFSAIGLLTTARLGRWADGFGAERARVVMAGIQFCGLLLMGLAGDHWWYLLAPLAISSIVGPLVDVTGRMTSLSKAPAVRTRLMSLYVTIMFLGGGFGSWAGTVAYGIAGWSGTVTLILSLSITVCLLSLHQARHHWGSPHGD